MFVKIELAHLAKSQVPKLKYKKRSVMKNFFYVEII